MKLTRWVYVLLLLAAFVGGYLVGGRDEIAIQKSAEGLARKFLTYRPYKFENFWGPMVSRGDGTALPIFIWRGTFESKELQMSVDGNDDIVCLHEIVTPRQFEKIVCADVK